MIRVSEPVLHGTEKANVLRALERNELAQGNYVRQFEAEWAAACATGFGVACSNGTTALLLALYAVGLQPGDEVLVPSLTYIATANAVVALGGVPVFVDVDPSTWTMDPELAARAVTSRTVGSIPVHLYGHPADMRALPRLGWVIEDAAEAHGALYYGRPVGSIGDIGCFSFYGNKVLTCGEGGMAVSNDPLLVQRMTDYRDVFHDPVERYVHRGIGLNYRLSNLAAAVGLGQVNDRAWHLARRAEVRNWYQELLADEPRVRLQGRAVWAEPSPWMVSVVLHPSAVIIRDVLLRQLLRRGIETRPVFYPLHLQPPYIGCGVRLPVAERIAARGFNLPTHADLSRADVEQVVTVLREELRWS